MKEVACLFRWASYGWLFLYALSVLFLGDDAFSSAHVPLTSGDGFLSWIGLLIELATPVVCKVILVGLLSLSIVMARVPRWWLGILLWFLFRIITHRMWLASNGGIQLMENMLFWSSFTQVSTSANALISTWGTSAFWIARLQLLLAYAAAAAHKFMGTSWLDGTAVSLVAADDTFKLGWLATSPAMCTVLTYATLAFMSLFPVAVWWKPTRRIWLCVGVLFHLSTAVFMGIPQMAFAFIACYALWLDESEALAILHRIQGWFSWIGSRALQPV
ncbi:MAG: HTTM domain-containing protein [Flavobacteriales bacterium]|nr:HTTM domain-containing protein [Flavobacteriales bacterium]MBP6574626.1 HTTM domain-containing protein [Flavobacteriales bacterium]